MNEFLYVLLKDQTPGMGNMLVRRKSYWEQFIMGKQYHNLSVVAEHTDANALLKIIEIATDIAPNDEKKRKAEADNSPEHVHKVYPLP